MKDAKHCVLLFYKYIKLNNPDEVKTQQRKLCEKLGLLGRIIIANEGINGTLEGTTANTEKYIEEMNKSALFKKITYKKSPGTGRAFPKLKIKIRPEIVTAGMRKLNPNTTTGKYITSEELHAWFEDKKEFYIIDMRNDYEYASGYFEGFVPSGIKNFFDLKNVLPTLSHLKDKTLVTVCTGGVRCEKASGFLVENGFKDVYQLKDGIHTYMEKYPGQHFKGKLYVFDNRITIGMNTEVVGSCMHCTTPCDSYVNCEYDMCHLHYICCNNCLDRKLNVAFCKKECKEKYISMQAVKHQHLSSNT